MYDKKLLIKCKYSKEGQRGSSFSVSLHCTKTAFAIKSCSTA